MSKAASSAVTLGADVGGKDAHAATREQYLALRRALASNCAGPYGKTFDEFALILRIDGSVQSWRKRGVDNIRLQRKLRYATADIFVPAKIWKVTPPSVWRGFLAKEVETAIRAITERAKRMKDDVDESRLLADVKRAVTSFVKSNASAK
jgi:hypothetical protein